MAYYPPFHLLPLPRVDHAILPVPTLTGNTANFNRIFRATDGAIYYVDHRGDSLRFTLPSVSTLVPLGTGVPLDNLIIQPVLPQGFLIGSTVPGWQYNIAAFGTPLTDAVRASNRFGLVMPGVPAHPFTWSNISNGDMVHGIVTDTTNNRVFRFELTIASPGLCYVNIVRTL